jgi:hypothetical protein
MPSTIYEAVGREYIGSTPIAQSYNAFRTQLFYGSVVIIGVATGYFYFTGQLSNGANLPVVPDL